MMNRLTKWVWLLAVIVTLVSTLPLYAEESTVTAATDGIDEIVVVGTDGRVYAFDHEGQQVFRSTDTGWSLVTTADLNNDQDHEIIAVGGNTIKIFDPQVSGTTYSYSFTYSGSSGSFTNVDVGNLISTDSGYEIALLRAVGNGKGRVIIYDLPTTPPANPASITPVRDVEFLVEWNNFSIGDYDGDGDDDFALTSWDSNRPSGSQNLFELRKGHNPNERLEDSGNNSQLSGSRWYDLATGNFVSTNGNKQEWVGTQEDGDEIVAQRWSNKQIEKLWFLPTTYSFVATANFRNDKENNLGVDQVVMLRNTSGSETGLRFVNHQGQQWVALTGLGTGWLNLAAGNVDEDQVYREAVLLRGNLIRVYRLAQTSTLSNFDCNTENECLEISGSFQAALALGDLGVDIQQSQPVEYQVSPTFIERGVLQDQPVAPATIHIQGEEEIGKPLTWSAIALPFARSKDLRTAMATDKSLSITITADGVAYAGETGTGELPIVSWITLSAYTGTTPATVTLTFSDTTVGSPVYEEKNYQAMVLVWQNQLSDDRFRYVDVSLTVGVDYIYLPMVTKD